MIPFQRVAANLLFFPYPVVVSTASLHAVSPHHPRYAFQGTMDALDAVTLSKYDRNIHPDLSQLARAYPQSPSPNSVAAPVRPRDDITNGEDEWHFYANPQIGVKHEREKGMTFSVRHDF